MIAIVHMFPNQMAFTLCTHAFKTENSFYNLSRRFNNFFGQSESNGSLKILRNKIKSGDIDSAFKYCDWMKVIAASLRVGFCDKWKRGLRSQAVLIRALDSRYRCKILGAKLKKKA